LNDSVLLALVFTVPPPPIAAVVAVRLTLALLMEFVPKLLLSMVPAVALNELVPLIAPLPFTWKLPVPALNVRSLPDTEPVFATDNAELFVDRLTVDAPAAETEPVTFNVPALLRLNVSPLPAKPSTRLTFPVL